MGKASRHKQDRQGRGAPKKLRSAPNGHDADPKIRAERALGRLVQGNPPGKITLAGAYALGYCALGLAQQEGDSPDWYNDLDPLETLFLGTVWPLGFRDSFEFANACTAWLRLMRETIHWDGIVRFVREVLAASEEYDLPIDLGELMFLVAGRLESIGLDQRKIPKDLLPEKALGEARVAVGPAEDFRLPDPLSDADEQVARFWTTVEVAMPHDGTTIDALREGLFMFGQAGLDIRGDAMVLLPALYAALVAGEHEELSEAGERSQAWALGLRPDSPLVPVTDVLLIAPQRGLGVDAALGCLLAVPAFSEHVDVQDRVWSSSPGRALTALAFELGYKRLTTRDGDVIHFGQAGKAALEAQLRKFEEKFGRPPGPEDPMFFDPDADTPQPVSATGWESSGVEMMEAVGICPAWIYAYQHTGGLLPSFDGSFATERDQTEWDEHADRYMALHDPGGQVDHDEETRKLQSMLVIGSLRMVADDPQHGHSVATRLNAGPLGLDAETLLLHEYLSAWDDTLTEQLRGDETMMETACEFARAWGGAELAHEVRSITLETPDTDISDAALLAAAAAMIERAADNG
jgi:hypothetical protein